jgi:hypothetical protein
VKEELSVDSVIQRMGKEDPLEPETSICPVIKQEYVVSNVI